MKNTSGTIKHRLAVLTGTNNLWLFSQTKKNNVYHYKPHFSLYEVGFPGDIHFKDLIMYVLGKINKKPLIVH